MFGNLGLGELAVLLVLGLLLFGPEKLPKMAGELGRGLRQLRKMANGVTEEIRSELGPEFSDLDLRSMHPKAFVQKHLLGDLDDVREEIRDAARVPLDKPTAPTAPTAPTVPITPAMRAHYDSDAT